MDSPSATAQLDRFLGDALPHYAEEEQTLFERLAAPHERDLVVFGAGGLGRKIVAGLDLLGLQPLAVADNNPNLWNSRIGDVRVLSPADAVSKFGASATFVVAVWPAGRGEELAAACHNLQQLGCRHSLAFHLLFWQHPDRFLPHFRVALPSALVQQSHVIREAFLAFDDEISRLEYLAQLNWLLGNALYRDPGACQDAVYFDTRIPRCSGQDCFVDCGAFDGDTIRSYLQCVNSRPDRVIGIEVESIRFGQLSEYVQTLSEGLRDRIELWNVAVGCIRGRVKFDVDSSALSEDGRHEVECYPLTEILGERKPTFIKMDIEGAEPDALMGAATVIDRYAPDLAVCVYHRPEHLWEIPLLIRRINPGYRLYLRRYAATGDLVCHAVSPTGSRTPVAVTTG